MMPWHGLRIALLALALAGISLPALARDFRLETPDGALVARAEESRRTPGLYRLTGPDGRRLGSLSFAPGGAVELYDRFGRVEGRLEAVADEAGLYERFDRTGQNLGQVRLVEADFLAPDPAPAAPRFTFPATRPVPPADGRGLDLSRPGCHQALGQVWVGCDEDEPAERKEIFDPLIDPFERRN